MIGIHAYRKKVYVALVLGLVLLSSCKDQDLQRLAKVYDVTTQATATLQAVVTTANALKPPMISDATSVKIMQMSIQINLSTKDAIQATRTVAKLDNTSRSKLANILKPSIDAVNAALVDQNVLGIQDAKTRDSIRGTLTLIQTQFAVVQTILNVR